MVWFMVRFHFVVVGTSAVLASLFFGINRAPLIVLESGFHNVSLIAAVVIPLGWSPMMPMVYGVVMFLSAGIMGINLHIIRKWKPKIFYTKWVFKPFRGMAIPPFGIFINPKHNTQIVIKHELIHWQQYKKLGLLGFYFKYVWEMIRFGYDKSPLESEARLRSKENSENLDSYSEMVHGKKPMTAVKRFLFSGFLLLLLTVTLAVINHWI